MARIACVLARGAASNHQHEWGTAFAAGLRRHGFRADITDQPFRADLLVLWGVRNRPAIDGQLNRGGEVCVLERGYLGDRFKWTSVSFGGGLNGRAAFRSVKADPTRFNKHFARLMRPWQRKGGYALLIGQVPGDMSLVPVGGNLDRWYEATARELDSFGYDVVFRPHPVAVKRGQTTRPRGARALGGTLEQALAGASLCVTFNSNTGVESVLSGVPTYAADIGSMAWPVTSHEIGDVLTPDRERWASELAWKQWTLDEMASGECWAAQCEAGNFIAA